ncbi:maleylpyruvate isomerase N-terminal domain-containing protein [Catenulispora acidiphila]
MQPSTLPNGRPASPDTTAGEHYRVIRSQLVDMAAHMSPDQAAAEVPALPGWSVQDTYAHITGISADILAGVPGNPHDPGWTAGHLSTRRGHSLAEICEEWEANGPGVEAALDDPARRRSVSAVLDAFHHGHDIRGALGRTEERHTPQAAFATALTIKIRSGPWAEAGNPPIEFATGSGGWRLGAPDAAPVAALSTSDFELSRLLIGRRSRAQMLAAGWSGDPEPIVDLLPAFGPPVTDLTE